MGSVYEKRKKKGIDVGKMEKRKREWKIGSQTVKRMKKGEKIAGDTN